MNAEISETIRATILGLGWEQSGRAVHWESGAM